MDRGFYDEYTIPLSHYNEDNNNYGHGGFYTYNQMPEEYLAEPLDSEKKDM